MFGANPEHLGDTSVPLSFLVAAECPRCSVSPSPWPPCLLEAFHLFVTVGNSRVQGPGARHPTWEPLQSVATSPDQVQGLGAAPQLLPLPLEAPKVTSSSQFHPDRGLQGDWADCTQPNCSSVARQSPEPLRCMKGGRGRRRVEEQSSSVSVLPRRLLTARPATSFTSSSAKAVGRDRRLNPQLALPFRDEAQDTQAQATLGPAGIQEE